jgi:hypothetical protein
MQLNMLRESNIYCGSFPIRASDGLEALLATGEVDVGSERNPCPRVWSDVEKLQPMIPEHIQDGLLRQTVHVHNAFWLLQCLGTNKTIAGQRMGRLK